MSSAAGRVQDSILRAEAVPDKGYQPVIAARLGRTIPGPLEPGTPVSRYDRLVIPSRLVVFDVPILAGVDPRRRPWQERRERPELLAQAFDVPLELSPVIQPRRDLALDSADGRLEGIALRDRTSTYRDGSRAGRWKVKDPSWIQREAWRYDRR
jgi:hypothetical protein